MPGMGTQKFAHNHETAAAPFFSGRNCNCLKPATGCGLYGISFPAWLVLGFVLLMIAAGGCPFAGVAHEAPSKPAISGISSEPGPQTVGGDSGPNSLVQTVSGLEGQARLVMATGDAKAAAKFYEESLQIRQSHPTFDTNGKLATLVNLAGIYHRGKQDVKAVPMYEEARAIESEAKGVVG